ncbi:MAG: hypothetical protein BMS9Abin17_1140 [Acidimicrobiia bacterium]|nr:MAG: hypothetical protein BMS9Abin17_1140 [Acidimicrobiia bacterium]
MFGAGEFGRCPQDVNLGEVVLDGYASHSTLHQVRDWHEGHCIQRVCDRLGSHNEIDKIRTTVSTTETRVLTSQTEQVITVVPASRGPAEYRASWPSRS